MKNNHDKSLLDEECTFDLDDADLENFDLDEDELYVKESAKNHIDDEDDGEIWFDSYEVEGEDDDN